MEDIYIRDYNDKLNDYDEILTPKDLQKILKISRTGVYNLLNTNKINYFVIGKQKRIPKDNLIKYIESECEFLKNKYNQ